MMIVSPSTFVENFGNIVLIAITISSLFSAPLRLLLLLQRILLAL